MITKRFRLDRVPEALDYAGSPPADAVKTMVSI
jgi:hypothetical protein